MNVSGMRFTGLQDKISRKPELDAVRVGSAVVLPFVNMSELPRGKTDSLAAVPIARCVPMGPSGDSGRAPSESC